MKYLLLILFSGLFLSCKKKPTATTIPIPHNDSVDSAKQTIQTDTNYFDSLNGSYNGISRYLDDSLKKYEEGADVLTVNIYGSAPNYIFKASCKRFSVQFILPDSLQKQPKFRLEQAVTDHQEILEVNFVDYGVAKIHVRQTWPFTQVGVITKYFFKL